MPTRYAGHLKEAGFPVLNIANNHILDAGFEERKNTITTLRNAGAPGNRRGNDSKSYEKTGKDCRPGIFLQGFTLCMFHFGYSRGARDYIQAEKDNDIVASFHGGAEGKHALHIPKVDETFLEENRGNVIRFAHAVIDAGADMVGHGPHVLRAMEVYKGKLIAYSLGNFLAYALFNLKGPNSLSVILRVRIDAATGSFLDGTLVPVHLVNGGIPEPDPTGESIRLIKELTATDIKPRSIVIEDNGVIRPLRR